MRYGDSVGSGRRYSGVSRLCDVGSTVRVGVSGMVWCDARCGETTRAMCVRVCVLSK